MQEKEPLVTHWCRFCLPDVGLVSVLPRSLHLQRATEAVSWFSGQQNEAILLIHFSSRYSASDIQKLLQEQLPEDLQKRCHPLLAGFS